MKTSRARRWVALAVLASSLAQSSAGALVLAGAAAHALLAGDHFHAFSVVARDGHLDVILSHRPGPAPVADRCRGDAPAMGETDHVFHVSGTDPLTPGARRGEWAPPPLAVAAALALPPAGVPSAAFRSAAASVAHRPDLLRTVVLRL